MNKLTAKVFPYIRKLYQKGENLQYLVLIIFIKYSSFLNLWIFYQVIYVTFLKDISYVGFLKDIIYVVNYNIYNWDDLKSFIYTNF